MPDVRILLIANLTKKTATAEELYKLFREFGPIRQVRLGRTPATEGTAIVVFERCDSAEAAQQAMNDLALGKRRLRVSVYDEVKDRKFLERRKRHREMDDQYRAHLKSSE